MNYYGTSYQNIFHFPFITFRIPQIFIFHSLALPLYFYFSTPIFLNYKWYFRAPF